MATPLQTVKSDHGTKSALVEKLLPILDREADETEAEFKERLLLVSNTKLLRLWDRAQAVKNDFGSREALADKVVSLSGGDADFRAKVMGLSTGRLLDLHGALKRKAN